MICRTRCSARAKDQADPPTATPPEDLFHRGRDGSPWGVATARISDERTLEPRVCVSMSAAGGPVASDKS